MTLQTHAAMHRPAAPLPAPDAVHTGRGWAGRTPRISVAIPTYRHDCSRLVDALAASPNAHDIEIVVVDDGGGDLNLVCSLIAAADRAACPVRIVVAAENRGRSAARNTAIGYCRADWILLLDADMLPDAPGFIGQYLRVIESHVTPSLVVGGYSLRQASQHPRFALHRWQAERSECLPAAHRSTAPGRHVFTSNVMAHRAILQRFAFDEGFSGWGWEDTDWGLRVAAHAPVIHIDNTATHLGLDEDGALIRKYLQSGGNFARVVALHRSEMSATPLHRAAELARKAPLRRPFAALAERVARDRRLPVSLRGQALKTMRAFAYAEALPC